MIFILSILVNVFLESDSVTHPSSVKKSPRPLPSTLKLVIIPARGVYGIPKLTGPRCILQSILLSKGKEKAMYSVFQCPQSRNEVREIAMGANVNGVRQAGRVLYW